MAFPVQFFSRFAIPAIIAAFLAGEIPEQFELHDRISKISDETLSKANHEGETLERFDYVIVGAGAAGAVLANRLSASGEHSVLLLEAGGDPNIVSELPYAIPFIGSGMKYDYSTIPQMKACRQLNGNCSWVKGKALGGTSSLNEMIYNRCNAKDYDSWANFTGDPIWKFNSVVDAFKVIEDYHGFYEDNPGPNHGIGGEMYIGKIPYLPSVEFVEYALQEKGIPLGDLNNGTFHSGFSKIDYNIKDGFRWGTYHGFLEPILNRTNLSIYRYAKVTKVNFDSNKKATGVTYKRHGATKTVAVNREVIISGGVVESPKLLLLSGIGPREELAELGIETIVDLPAVGRHLQDHPGVVIDGFYMNKTFGREHLTPKNINEFIANRTGPATSILVAKGKSIAPRLVNGYTSSTFNNDPSWPDLHFYIREELINVNSWDEVDTMHFKVEVVRTKTEGSIKLASNDPDEYPLIDPNYYGDAKDIDIMLEGIEYILDIFLNTTVLQSVGLQFNKTVHPISGCSHHAFPPSREYWKCYLEQKSQSSFHPSSTCRMGPNSNVAVVDSKLSPAVDVAAHYCSHGEKLSPGEKIFGTSGLRVIDSSVMPFVPNGNTNFPTIMIGEMGSRMVVNSLLDQCKLRIIN